MGQSKQRKKLMGADYGKAPNPWHRLKLGVYDRNTQAFVEKSFEGWEICPEDDNGEGAYKVVNTFDSKGWVGFVVLRKVEA